jgi:diguanylate cyclase (GGDEF)-like protein
MMEALSHSELVRPRIEAALQDRFARLPDDCRQAFELYQDTHYRRFLLYVNLLGQAAYWSYAFVDMIIIPDVGVLSLWVRTLFIGVFLPVVLAAFYWSKNVRLLDLLLPMQIVVAAVTWFLLLGASQSQLVGTYQYAAVIFIVLANLGIQVYFLPSVITSLTITAVTMTGVYDLAEGHGDAILVFTLVYLPVFLFSLFISWSTTQDRRRAFLRSILDDLARQELAEANRKLAVQAHTDPLTGLHNRRSFEELARREFALAARNGSPMSLLLFDIDHFKHVNDSYGHDVGDKVLQSVAKLAKQELRGHDVLARFGGEEFIALLPSLTQDDAYLVAERLRACLAQCRIAVDDSTEISITISVGLSRHTLGPGDLGVMIKAADKALYQAKKQGRNRVCVAF